MYSICQICGRRYTGGTCLRCTQQAIDVQSFGDETLFLNPTGNITGRTALSLDLARLRLSDGRSFAVCKPICRIGQDPSNDIVINEDSVARFHAQITFDESEPLYLIRDLGTKSGTFINGTQITLDQVIMGGDQVRIGNYRFFFESDLAL